jgi:predicted transcriptional regulator of viral defense system
MSATGRDRLLRVACRRGALSAREAARLGIHSQQLSRLVAEGRLERIARGQYRWPDHPVTEHHALAITVRAVPHAVVCLLSALSFHGIGTSFLVTFGWRSIAASAGRALPIPASVSCVSAARR